VKKLRPFLKFYFLQILIFSCFALPVKSQNRQVIHQNLIWFTYTNNTRFSGKWFLMTEIYERRFLSPFKHHHFLARTHLHYQLNHGWDVGAGFSLSLQSPQDPTSTSTLVIPEYRPHIEVNNKHHFKHVLMSNRLRIENRYIQNTLNGELANGFTSSYRARYYLGFEFILKYLGEDQTIKFKISDEIHFDAGKNINFGTFDQNRFYAAFSFDIRSSLAFEIGFLHWYQRLKTGYQYYNRNIIRLGINQKINLSKTKAG
jgi:hypothetical protein